MPYVTPDRRELLVQFDAKNHRFVVNTLDITSPEDLAFVFYRLCQLYVIRNGRKFETLNGIVGVLETTKGEFSRRILAPYEDRKMRENGDVE